MPKLSSSAEPYSEPAVSDESELVYKSSCFASTLSTRSDILSKAADKPALPSAVPDHGVKFERSSTDSIDWAERKIARTRIAERRLGLTAAGASAPAPPKASASLPVPVGVLILAAVGSLGALYAAILAMAPGGK